MITYKKKIHPFCLGGGVGKGETIFAQESLESTENVSSTKNENIYNHYLDRENYQVAPK